MSLLGEMEEREGVFEVRRRSERHALHLQRLLGRRNDRFREPQPLRLTETVLQTWHRPHLPCETDLAYGADVLGDWLVQRGARPLRR